MNKLCCVATDPYRHLIGNLWSHVVVTFAALVVILCLVNQYKSRTAYCDYCLLLPPTGPLTSYNSHGGDGLTRCATLCN